MQFYAFSLLPLTSFIQLLSLLHQAQKSIKALQAKLQKTLNHPAEGEILVQTLEVKEVNLIKIVASLLELPLLQEKIIFQATWEQKVEMMMMKNQARKTMTETEEMLI